MGHEISRRLIGGEWRTADGDDGGNGGSQFQEGPFAVATPALLAGPQLLYTPAPGEIVYLGLPANYVLSDYSDTVAVSDISNAFMIASFSVVLGFIAATSPVYAMLQAESNSIVEGPWQAGTFYYADSGSSRVGSAVVADSRVWYNAGAEGTSGGVSPDFAGTAPGGTVNDGADIIWTDTGYTLPSIGSFDITLLKVIT